MVPLASARHYAAMQHAASAAPIQKTDNKEADMNMDMHGRFDGCGARQPARRAYRK